MGDRVYEVPIDNVTISAIQDVFSLKSGASNGIEIHHIHLEAGGGVNSPAEIRLVLKRGTGATVTQGTGGTAPTPVAADVNDTLASGSTAHINDVTTQLTATTLTNMLGFQWNVLVPFDYLPAPEDRERISVSQAFALNCPAAPASTVVSGFIKWKESP